MQHDLFINPNARSRRGFPFLVDMQSGLVRSDTTVVAPLTLLVPHAPSARMLPMVEHDGVRYVVVLTLMTNVHARVLRRSVGTIAAWRDDLTRALDWLFFGI